MPAENVKQLICPQCGAPLQKNGDLYFCPYCDYREEKAATPEKNYKKIAYEQKLGEIKAEKRSRAKSRFIAFVALVITVTILGAVFRGKVESRPELDPFDYAVIDVSGVSGSGRLSVLQKSTDEVPANTISFRVSQSTNLSNGDVVSITASSSQYRFERDTYAYTVSGLQTYEIDLDAISEQQLVLIEESSMIRLRNLGTGTNGKGQNIRRVRMYERIGDNSNIVFDVYAADFALAEGGVRTVYLVVYYTNLLLNESSDASLRYTEQMYVGRSISIGTWRDGVVTGYETLEDVDVAIRTSMSEAETLSTRDFE